jgi:hypothetical protein
LKISAHPAAAVALSLTVLVAVTAALAVAVLVVRQLALVLPGKDLTVAAGQVAKAPEEEVLAPLAKARRFPPLAETVVLVLSLP